MQTYSSIPVNEKVRTIVCPICGSITNAFYCRIPNAQFVQCTQCTHVYQNPQPVFDDLKNRYREHYFQYELENEENFFNLMVLGLTDIDFEKWENPLRTRGTFLDIGCATGRLLSYMKERNWEVQGVELCEASATYGMTHRGVPIFIGPLEEAAFAMESFSFVHASHLIEHLPDPRDFLSRVHALLQPGGHAVLVTPNRTSLQSKLFHTQWRSCIADHLHLFSKKTLNSLSIELGFQVLQIQTWGGIAKGLAQPLVKGILDRAAKRFGFGDVMLFHLIKQQSA